MIQKKPNILLLLPDSHRGDWMPYGADTFQRMGMDPLPLRMPNIKRLMDDGVTFTRAVTPSPLCAPARACLAAGVGYDQCGTASNEVDFPLNKKTFYAVLRDNGYSVGGVGKFDLHKPTHWWGLDGWIDDLDTLGFTHAVDNAGKIDAIVSGREAPKDPYMKYLYDKDLAKVHIEDMTGRKGHKTSATPLPEEAYCDNWLTEKGLQLLKEFPQNRPWFLQVNFTGPHGPWDITERMKKRWEEVLFPLPNRWNSDSEMQINGVRQNYAAMLENIDRNIGLLLEKVRERGELGNTIVIYSSDHGEMLGDSGRFGKCVPYRGSVGIPLVIAGPGVQRGVVSDALVELQDLAATITEYAGTAMKEAVNSISLKRLLEGKTDKHREYTISALEKDGKHVKHGWKMISGSRYKLVLHEEQKPELYDLADDPWENNDISDQNSAVVNKLTDYLKEHF